MASSNRPGTVDYSKWDSIADSDSDDEALNLLHQLEVFCGSDSLSLSGVRKRIDLAYAVGAEPTHGDAFLHRACENNALSHEIAASLLRAFPGAANVISYRFCPDDGEEEYAGSFALHHACANHHCPNSVIELLVKKNPEALRHLCVINDGLCFDEDGYYEDCLSGLPLHYYFASRAETGGFDLDTVKLMVETYPESLTTGNSHGVMPICTLLCQLSELAGYDSILKYLVEKAPTSLQSTVKWDLTPLHIVCGYNDISTDVVQMMIEAWPDSVNQMDDGRCLPLHNLCWNDGLGEGVLCEVLSLLIKASPSSVRQFDEEGQLPIHCTVSLEACKMLVNAYPESVRMEEDNEGNPISLPIHEACRKTGTGIEVVQYLLDLYPGSISIRDRDGNLPMHCACHDAECGVEVVKLLFDLYPEGIEAANGCGNLPIHRACSSYYGTNGNVEMVKYLLDGYPAGVKTKNNDGDLPIHKASSMRSVEIANLLLHTFPDGISAKNKKGYLPLHSAVSSWNEEGNVVRLLLARNQDSVMVTVEGKLPIQMACNLYSPNLDDLKNLFDAYPESISIADKDGKTVIDIVRGNSSMPNKARSKAIEFLEEQIAFIASLKAQDNSAVTTQDASGRLLIHRFLYKKNRPGAIKLLAQAHPKSLQVADHGGMSPLHIACDLGGCDMIEFLLGKYAGAAAEANSDNKLPIQLLCERGESAFGQFEGSTKYVETVWHLLLASPEICKTWS